MLNLKKTSFFVNYHGLDGCFPTNQPFVTFISICHLQVVVYSWEYPNNVIFGKEEKTICYHMAYFEVRPDNDRV